MSLTNYDREKIYPLSYFQIDTKEVADIKTLPHSVYQHLLDRKLPSIQWTALDIYSGVRFITYSKEKSFTNGFAFMILVQLWLRDFGFYQKLYFQTDRGEEFGGKSFTKLENLQKRYFSPLNIQLLRTRKYHWWDNGYVERVHRTDDEEFYIPYLTKIKDEKSHFTYTLWWNYIYNCQRAHTGKRMNNLTPYQKLKESYPWVTEYLLLFPPIILDKISSSKLFTWGGHDVLTHYLKRSSSTRPPHLFCRQAAAKPPGSSASRPIRQSSLCSAMYLFFSFSSMDWTKISSS